MTEDEERQEERRRRRRSKAGDEGGELEHTVPRPPKPEPPLVVVDGGRPSRAPSLPVQPEDMGPVSVPIEQGELKWKIRAHAAEAKILKMQLADLQRQVQEAETALRRTAGEVIEAVQPKLPPGYAAKAFNEKDGTVAATFDPVNAGRKPPV